MPGDSSNDQKRIMTPKQAFKNGSVSGIVIGRSLTKGNIKKNIQKTYRSLKQMIKGCKNLWYFRF